MPGKVMIWSKVEYIDTIAWAMGRTFGEKPVGVEFENEIEGWETDTAWFTDGTATAWSKENGYYDTTYINFWIGAPACACGHGLNHPCREWKFDPDEECGCAEYRPGNESAPA